MEPILPVATLTSFLLKHDTFKAKQYSWDEIAIVFFLASRYFAKVKHTSSYSVYEASVRVCL